MPYNDEKVVDVADVRAGNGQTQDNRSSNQSMTRNLVADANPEEAKASRKVIISRRGRWDQPERLKYWDRSKRGGGHREQPGSVQTIEGYSQHELTPRSDRGEGRTLVASGNGMVRLYFLCSSSRRIRVLDPGSSASRGSSRSVILTVRQETTSRFPWKLTCMSSFLTRGKSNMAVTVRPSADSRYFTLERGREHRSGSRSEYTRGMIVADTVDKEREGEKRGCTGGRVTGIGGVAREGSTY